MTVMYSKLHPMLGTCLAAMLLQACGGGGGGVDDSPKLGVNGTYLYVSMPDFYFGTNDVGTTVTQSIQIANRGADIYPLNSLTIEGENAEEFAADLFDDVVLQPAEAITVGISFKPITDGRKFANFIVDYDTIQMVDESVNLNEQSFYQGKALEDAGNYQRAKRSYSEYIEGDPVTTNKRRAAIKLPVIEESETYGDGDDFDLYLSALDQRDAGELDEAVRTIDSLQILYAQSYLADDALYLKGYIQLIDEKNYTEALRTMQALRKQYPDSTYYDTALFSEALAQQEIGNDAVAREMLLDLRYRHTGVDILGVTMAKDNLVSRLWFDRANSALETFDLV